MSKKENVIFVIGQDVASIDAFMDYLKGMESSRPRVDPQGFMVYTNISDLRGLDEPEDPGGGVQHARPLLERYPEMDLIQIGLYMKGWPAAINRGELDDHIGRLGRWIKATGKQVYLRIGYEFDHPENEYEPAEYIDSYRRIADWMRSAKIDNVEFVWHSVAWGCAAWPAFDPMKWYPGDDYVDWIGLSFFEPERAVERNTLTDLAHQLKKPIMIAEGSPWRRRTPDAMIDWIDTLFQYVDEGGVEFISYINTDWDVQPMFAHEKWGDTRLERDPVVIDRFFASLLRKS